MVGAFKPGAAGRGGPAAPRAGVSGLCWALGKERRSRWMFLTLKDITGAAVRGCEATGSVLQLPARERRARFGWAGERITLFHLPRWKPQLARGNCCYKKLLLLS